MWRALFNTALTMMNATAIEQALRVNRTAAIALKPRAQQYFPDKNGWILIRLLVARYSNAVNL